MISSLYIPAWSQRDSRWAGQRLGTVDGITIGSHGCLITSISMMNAGFGNELTPNTVDDLFTNNNGYANGNLVIWTAINRILPDCSLTRVAYCSANPAPTSDIAGHIEGGGLVILQVGFGGNQSAMHFVLAVGHDNGDIIFLDPWYGDRVNFRSLRYGTGDAAIDIINAYFFKDGVPSIKPERPVAKLPTEAPLVEPQLETVVPSPEPTPEPTPEPVVEVVVEPAPEPIIEVVEPPVVPIVETPVETVQKPEWEASWTPGATPRYVVAVPSAEVYDFVHQRVVTNLTGGEPLSPVAGFFTVGGSTYVRTQKAVEKGWWNGVLLGELREVPENPSPNPHGFIDGVLPPAEDELFNYEDPLNPPELPPTPEILIDARDWFKASWQGLLGLTLSVLRPIGRLYKLSKRK